VTGSLGDGIHSVRVQHWDRRLFDELIPLPDGTSYNSYLIEGSEKTALIDTVDPEKSGELLSNLEKLGVKKLDYVIANHAEKDHSGSIPEVLKAYPDAQVVTNAKCKEMLKDLMSIDDGRFKVIGDGETISLGDRTLRFVFAPWVHWPETMLTLLEEDNILFTCDLFGSHLASSELYATDECLVYEAAKRYYAEIMMPFRGIIKKHIPKVRDLKVELIAPSHGPVYDNPEFILSAYEDWTSDEVKNKVVIVYASMWGATKAMVDYLVSELVDAGITVKPFNLTKTDVGDLAIALVDAATIVIASPTVLHGPHPAVAYATVLANALRPKAKYATIIGSYGWGGQLVETLTGMIPNLKVEVIDPVVIKGFPRQEDYRALKELANQIKLKHETLGGE